MADYDLVQVSELTATETPANADVLPIQQGTELKKITYANLKSNVVSDEATARQNADDLKLNKPTGGNGTPGQMLLTNGDGTTQWASPDDTLATTGKAADAKATGDAIKAVDANLAAPYSTSATYAVGDYCTKDGVLKRCNTAITTAEAWNSAHWDDAKLGGDVSTLRSALSAETEAREAADEALEASVAKKDGTYEDLTSGNTEQLLSDVYTDNSEPYLFRKTGGSDKVGSREYLDKIVGGSLVVNQLFDFSQDSTKWIYNGSISRTWDNGKLTLTNGITAAAYVYQELNEIANHVYLYYADAKGTLGEGISYNPAISIYAPGGQTQITRNIGSTRGVVFGIWKAQSEFTTRMQLRPNDPSNILEVWMYEVVDLTAMFGSTIADYIYTLETATEGAGVAWLKQYIDLDTYHPYSEPTLKHVEGLQSHDIVGFNQWDEDYALGFWNVNGGFSANTNGFMSSKNAIRVIPNTDYCLSIQGAANQTIYLCWYDADMGFIKRETSSLQGGKRVITPPTNASYMQFSTEAFYGTTYKNDICINLSDPTKNGTYEPYQKRSYPLDSSVILRGIPTLVDGKLKYDGDEYLYNGLKNIRYGIVDMGTLTWTYSSDYDYPYFVGVMPSDAVSAQSVIGKQTVVSSKYLGIPNIGAATFRTANYNGMMCQNTGVTTKRLIVQDSNYTDADAFKASLSGIYLVYLLETPTTENAEPFHQLQICDTYGTEEFVTTSEIPVGTETRYPEDLKSKIEGLPWDLSMIAPIENGTTASKAYTTGQYFLRNNVFCKALTNIASGATFTLNTNYSETTVAAELYTALH